MPWTYSQGTGELQYNGKHVARGYSGKSSGRNNPKLEYKASTGPIPQGKWAIGKGFKHKNRGPMVMSLTPVDHFAYFRDHFLIHGDNASHNASEGCIILGPAARKRIMDSGDRELIVVP